MKVFRILKRKILKKHKENEGFLSPETQNLQKRKENKGFLSPETQNLQKRKENESFLSSETQNHKKHKENKAKSDTCKSSKSVRPMTLQNDEIQVPRNISKTNVKSTKSQILDRPKHQNYQY